MTIEGLTGADGKLHPLQQGVIDEQGFQCGYCAPGFLMAASGFLKTNPNPTRRELAHGVSGNICRCQDYEKILDCPDAWRTKSQGGVIMPDEVKFSATKARRQELHPPGSAGEGDRGGQVHRGLSRRGYALLQAIAESHAPCPRKED